jgi:parallel beta-helix repeat protein
MVRMSTGDNAGASIEVETFIPGDSAGQAYVGLRFTMRRPFQVGDTGEIRRECSRKFTGHNSCDTFFGAQKGAFFNGEPFINIGDSPANSIPGVHVPTTTGGNGGGTTYNPGAGTSVDEGGTNPVSTSPTRTVGATVVDPVDYGADPTNTSDSTAAFNAAYAALPADGGIVRPSAGTYKIDPDTMIQPGSYTMLDLATNNVTLRATYTTVDHRYVIQLAALTDVEIVGGTIYGYRNLGPVPAGTTAEWGHCIACGGSQRVTIRDIVLREAMGDGISVGGNSGNPSRDVIIKNVSSIDNRRQGLSIVYVNGLTVDGGTFDDTTGTSPECGIDIEPEANQYAKNITIQNASFRGNHKYGINILQRSDGGIVDQVTIKGCTIGGTSGDGNNSNGLVTTGGSNVMVQDNTISYNSATGIVINNTTNLAVVGNSFKNNYYRNGPTTRTERDVTGIESPYTDKDILVRSAGSGMNIGTNHYLSN